jgi:hypothetical protein
MKGRCAIVIEVSGRLSDFDRPQVLVAPPPGEMARILETASRDPDLNAFLIVAKGAGRDEVGFRTSDCAIFGNATATAAPRSGPG